MERLLETLVDKISSLEEGKEILTPESLGTEDILPPDLNNASCSQSIQETAPLFALFDNTAVSISPSTYNKRYRLTPISLDEEKSTSHKLQRLSHNVPQQNLLDM